jgi:probable phosphomutase (TIGR03848 family)
MTTILLIRHGLTDDVGRVLSGRAAGVPLNPEGRRQAAALAERLRDVPLDAILTGPLERARETAEAIAARRGVRVQTIEPLQEFDTGTWTGREIASMEANTAWQRFNEARSVTPAPGGELMLSVQMRVVSALLDLRERYPDGTVAVISHGDVIRAALLYFLGMPIDLLHRLEISPARVSVVQLGDGAPRVLQVNGESATR